MDLSDYDTANDDIISASSAPESAVTSDERVNYESFNDAPIKFLSSQSCQYTGRTKILTRLTENHCV